MGKLIIIAAIGKNRELGKNNGLIWHFKEDMKFFRETTNGKRIVMGYNTYKSLPGALKNRENIVLTSKDINDPNITVIRTIEDILEFKTSEIDTYIIGGAKLYESTLPYVDEMYLTHIEDTCNDADVYFPNYIKYNFKSNILNTIEENNIILKIYKYTK